MSGFEIGTSPQNIAEDFGIIQVVKLSKSIRGLLCLSNEFPFLV